MNLIQIDTDGNYFADISGAKQAPTSQPVVLFECDVFGNSHYVEERLETLAPFHAAGYHPMLLYEKFGYPMGRFELHDLTHFTELIFNQLTKKHIYFDILLKKEQALLPLYALKSLSL